jgi:hypothetical protein
MPWNHVLNTPRHHGSCLYHAMTSILVVMNICTFTLGMELMGSALKLCKEPNMIPQ